MGGAQSVSVNIALDKVVYCAGETVKGYADVVVLKDGVLLLWCSFVLRATRALYLPLRGCNYLALLCSFQSTTWLARVPVDVVAAPPLASPPPRLEQGVNVTRCCCIPAGESEARCVQMNAAGAEPSSTSRFCDLAALNKRAWRGKLCACARGHADRCGGVGEFLQGR